MHYKRGSRLTDEHVPEFHELNNGKIARDMFSYEHIPCYSFISASAYPSSLNRPDRPS